MNIEFTKSFDDCIQNLPIGPNNLEYNIKNHSVPAIKLYRRDLRKKQFNVDVSLIGRPGGEAKYGIMSDRDQYLFYAEDFTAPISIPTPRKIF